MQANANRQYTFGEFLLEPTERRLSRVNLERIDLTGKPFDLLVLLVENQGRLITRDDLLNKIWGGTNVQDQSLTEAISRIRKVLDPNTPDKYIERVSGQGYRFAGHAQISSTDSPSTDLTGPSSDESRPARPRLIALVTLMTAILVCVLGGELYLRSPTRQSRVLYKKALALEGSGNDGLAMDSLKEALRLEPNYDAATLRAAWILYEDDQNEEALHLLGGLLASGSISSTTRLKAEALSAMAVDDLETAQRKLELSLEADTKSVDTLQWVVEDELTRGQLDGASKYVVRCLQIDASDPTCNYERLELLIRQNDFDAALKAYPVALRATGGYPWLHELAGYANLALGHTEIAKAEFQILERLGQQFANEVHIRASQEGLAQIALREEHFSDASERIENAMATSSSASARTKYSLFLAGIDALAARPGAAVNRVQTTTPVLDNDEQISTAVRILVLAGDTQSARVLLDSRTAENKPLGKNLVASKSFLDGAEALHSRNDYERAKADLTEAQDLDPDPLIIFSLANAEMANRDWSGATRTLQFLLNEKGSIVLDSYASLIPAGERNLRICMQH